VYSISKGVELLHEETLPPERAMPVTLALNGHHLAIGATKGALLTRAFAVTSLSSLTSLLQPLRADPDHRPIRFVTHASYWHSHERRLEAFVVAHGDSWYSLAWQGERRSDEI